MYVSKNLISFLRCGGEEKRREGSGKVPRVDSLGMGRKRFGPPEGRGGSDDDLKAPRRIPCGFWGWFPGEGREVLNDPDDDPNTPRRVSCGS